MVNQVSTTTALSSNPNPATFNQSVTLTATVSSAGATPTGTAAFYANNAYLGTGTLNANGVASLATSALPVGANALTATYWGDACHAVSKAPALNLTVTKATPSSTLSASRTTLSYGQSVTFTATVPAGYTGTVTFMDGGSVLGSANTGGRCDGSSAAATYTASALRAGSHSITASLSSDADYNGFTSSALVVTVTQATPNATLASSLNPSTFGQSVTFTATVAPGAQGSVTFLNGASSLGTGTLNSSGVATLTTSALTGGSHSVQAVHSGDPNFANSTASLTQVVTKATPVLTWTAPAAITAGTPLGSAQLNASANNLPGTFSYQPSAGTVLAAGTGQRLTVTFTPTDAVDNASATLTVTLNVNLPSQTITFASLAAKALGSAPFTLSASASSGLPVSFSSSNLAVATVQGSQVTLVGAGTTTITASQAGSGSFAPAESVSQALTVTPRTQPLSLQVSALCDGAFTASLLANVCGQVTSANGIRTLTVNEVKVTVNANGSFNCPVQLKEGVNTITTVATDLTGLTTTDSRRITLDGTVSALTLTAPAENLATCNPSMPFTGSVAVAKGTSLVSVTYNLNGGPTLNAVVSGSQFQFNVTNLLPGLNTVEITGLTSDNRVVMEKRSITELAGFTLAVTSPGEDLITSASSFLVVGTVANNATPVTVTLTCNGHTYTPAVVGGSFQQLLELPSDMAYDLKVEGTDLANDTITIQRNLIRVPAVAPAGNTTPDSD